MPAGTYKLYVNPPSPYGAFWYGGNDFGSAAALAETSSVTLNFNLNTLLSGTVRNNSGTIVPNTSINAYLGGTGTTWCTYLGGGMTDAAGTYSINLPAGTYKLFVNPPSPYPGLLLRRQRLRPCDTRCRDEQHDCEQNPRLVSRLD